VTSTIPIIDTSSDAPLEPSRHFVQREGERKSNAAEEAPRMPEEGAETVLLRGVRLPRMILSRGPGRDTEAAPMPQHRFGAAGPPRQDHPGEPDPAEKDRLRASAGSGSPG
jgi:hypothetical protein